MTPEQLHVVMQDSKEILATLLAPIVAIVIGLRAKDSADAANYTSAKNKGHGQQLTNAVNNVIQRVNGLSGTTLQIAAAMPSTGLVNQFTEDSDSDPQPGTTVGDLLSPISSDEPSATVAGDRASAGTDGDEDIPTGKPTVTTSGNTATVTTPDSQTVVTQLPPSDKPNPPGGGVV